MSADRRQTQRARRRRAVEVKTHDGDIVCIGAERHISVAVAIGQELVAEDAILDNGQQIDGEPRGERVTGSGAA